MTDNSSNDKNSLIGNGLKEHNELCSHHLRSKMWEYAVVMADVLSIIGRMVRCQSESYQ